MRSSFLHRGRADARRADGASSRARRISCARCRGSASTAAARATSPPFATASPRPLRSRASWRGRWRPAGRASRARPRPCGPTAARSSAELIGALADDLPLVKRDGGFVRAGSAAAARRGAQPARREPAGDRRDAGGLRGGDRASGSSRSSTTTSSAITSSRRRRRARRCSKAPLNATFIHRQTMAGALRFTTDALIELEARIASAADRALRARARRLRAPAPGVSRRGRCLARVRRRDRRDRRRGRAGGARRRNATGRVRSSTPRSPFGSRAAAIRWSRRR